MPSLIAAFKATEREQPTRGATDDVLIGGITIAAILLLIGTGTNWLHNFLGLTTVLARSQMAVTSTLLLNIALILFGWRRFRDLREEIARRTEAEEQATRLASHDALTGYFNRRAFQARGQQAIDDWAAAGSRVAAIVVDIDSFKSVNDLFGHAAGDEVIAETAHRIADELPSDALFARLGGDEFAALIAYDDEAVIERIGKAIVAALTAPIMSDAVAIPTSSSVGIAHHHAGGSLEVLLRQADVAMYRAKRSGRAQHCYFDDESDRILQRSDQVEAALRHAIAIGEIQPAYEPLIDLRTAEPMGYEMLARWHLPILGHVDPAEFIAVAEASGQISLLSDLLFRKAFTDAQAWPTHLALSVNVSPLQLRDPWFSQKLLKLLAETGLPPTRLIIEITESAIVDNVAVAAAVFTSLRNLGVRMVLDDFGTGYSSIASLRSLPFDCVKLDREFVARMNEHGGSDSVAEAVLQLGKSLNLPVVAEGIETLAAMNRLATLDCAIGQGHYFGRSLSHQDVIDSHDRHTHDGHGPRVRTAR